MFFDKFMGLCEERGVSPTRVLVSLGISKGSLTRWKSGGAPRNEIKKKIADYFEVPAFRLNETPVSQDDLKAIIQYVRKNEKAVALSDDHSDC